MFVNNYVILQALVHGITAQQVRKCIANNYKHSLSYPVTTGAGLPDHACTPRHVR